jgi:hypothetical protein
MKIPRLGRYLLGAAVAILASTIIYQGLRMFPESTFLLARGKSRRSGRPPFRPHSAPKAGAARTVKQAPLRNSRCFYLCIYLLTAN